MERIKKELRRIGEEQAVDDRLAGMQVTDNQRHSLQTPLVLVRTSKLPSKAKTRDVLKESFGTKHEDVERVPIFYNGQEHVLLAGKGKTTYVTSRATWPLYSRLSGFTKDPVKVTGFKAVDELAEIGKTARLPGVAIRNELRRRQLQELAAESKSEVEITRGRATSSVEKKARRFGSGATVLGTSEEYSLFPSLTGVMAIVTSADNSQILLGIRSNQLGGTHKGMATVPAGLARPNTSLVSEAKREQLSEAGLKLKQGMKRGFIALNPAAPNPAVGFHFIGNPESRLKETWEAEGKTFFWVPKSTVERYLKGDKTSFQKAVETRMGNKQVEIAPDVCDMLKEFIKARKAQGLV